MTALAKTKQAKNYSVFESGALSDWKNNSVELGSIGKIPGKLFLKELLGFTSCEISINSLPVGGAMPFLHKHDKNEEIYIFLSGKGEFQIDDDTFPIKEGSVVRVSPKGERAWRNTSKTETLVFLCLQAVDDSFQQAGTISDGLPVDKPLVWP
jgi:mannose-6-phosphate isomerase-like protein (cupin superfamily)